MKTIFSKVMQVGRATVFTVGLAVVLAVMLGVATTAIAATPGDPFRLGKGNVIKKLTKLVGQGKDPRLVVQNKGNGAALRLLVKPGKSPMTVNSDTKVANLNADSLDGEDSTEFLSSGNFYQKNEIRNGSLNGVNVGQISCNSGDQMLSGGYGLLAGSGHVFTSQPLLSGAATGGWSVAWTGDTQITMAVHCADLTP